MHMARRSLLLAFTLEEVLSNPQPGSAFVASNSARLGSAACGCGQDSRTARRTNTACMHRREGAREVAKKAVAAGLLGVQFLLPAVAFAEELANTRAEVLPRVETATAGARGNGLVKSAAALSTEREMIDEVEKLELKTEVEGDLKAQSKKKPAPVPSIFKLPARGKQSPRVKLMEIPKAKLAASVGTIQGLAPYLDEVEYLITARSWDYLKGFLGVFASCEGDFVDLIDGMYPTDSPSDVSARDSMQLEAQNVFLAVDDLYQASMSKKVKGAEKAYVQLALAYDRFMKAGNIIPRYDPVSSTEMFFQNIPDEMLRYERDSKVPLEVRDKVLILKGPDMGRTGRIVGIIKSRNEGIVRVDGQYKEMRILELQDIARQLPDNAMAMSQKKSKK